jgi:flagellar biosynthesis protein FlhB
LRNRIGGIHGVNLLKSLLKIGVASAAMGMVIWLSSSTIRNTLGTATKVRLFDLGVSIPLGLLVLYSACRIMRVQELEVAVQSLAAPLQRRLPFLRDKIG